jgi:hypothetical protein
MSKRLREQVRQRAGQRCEYCLLAEHIHPGRFTIEHIIPEKHGGLTEFHNLAWSCLHCNLHRGTDLVGRNGTGKRAKLVPLFNPRRHKWNRHFRFEGPYIIARTATGRVTVSVLAMNDPDRVRLRQNLIVEGLLPPTKPSGQ